MGKAGKEPEIQITSRIKTKRAKRGRKPKRTKCAIKQISRGGVGRKKVTWLRPPGFAKLSTFGSGGS